MRNGPPPPKDYRPPREVYAGHGSDRAMGYKYRARIEHRTYQPFRWFWQAPKPSVTEYRYVIERHHMSWSDHFWGEWRTSQIAAEYYARVWLDNKSAAPKGIYLTD